jgi:lincosamide nucleotidyltransferase A/C/D/E
VKQKTRWATTGISFVHEGEDVKMDSDAVLAVLAALRAAQVRVWLAGGWGIDALLGRTTRPHRDADLLHDSASEDRALTALAGLGYRPGLDARPVRFVLSTQAAAGTGTGHELDLHPLHLAADGSAWQAADTRGGRFTYPADCFTTGRIGGVTVPCVSVAQQIYFHQGYSPTDRDRADMAALRARFGVTTHF